MNHKIWTLTLTAATLGFANTAFAQREAPNRGERRQQRQQENQNLTPEQLRQNFEARFQERLKSATPEQRERMMQGRARIEERLREQGIDPNNPADMQRAMQAMGGMGGNQQGGRGRGGNVAQTPASRDEARRALMNGAGITEKATQDAIIEFMNAEEKAREPLLQLARAAATSLDPDPKKQYSRNPNGELIEVVVTPTPGTDEAVSSSFEAYQNALVADKTRYQSALAALDAKISYTTKPRLKAFLSLVGVIDNEALALGGAAAIFASAAPQNVAPQNVAPQNGRQDRASRRAQRTEQQ